MRTITLVLVSAILFLVSHPEAGAACTPTTSEPEVVVGSFYVDNDLCQWDCLFSIWIYEESNGIAGLQRGDEVRDDTCGGQIEADTILC